MGRREVLSKIRMLMALALLTIMVMQCPRPFYVQAEEAPISMVGSSLRLGDGIEVSFFFHPGQSLMESHDGAAIEFSLNGAVSETVTVEELLTQEAHFSYSRILCANCLLIFFTVRTYFLFEIILSYTSL